MMSVIFLKDTYVYIILKNSVPCFGKNIIFFAYESKQIRNFALVMSSDAINPPSCGIYDKLHRSLHCELLEL